MYTQALVNGYWIVIEAAGKQYDFRVDRGGSFRLCPPGQGQPPSRPAQPNFRVRGFGGIKDYDLRSLWITVRVPRAGDVWPSPSNSARGFLHKMLDAAIDFSAS